MDDLGLFIIFISMPFILFFIYEIIESIYLLAKQEIRNRVKEGR